MMDPCPSGDRLPPESTKTRVGSVDPRGVVVVDIDNTLEAFKVAQWLQSRGHRPIVAPWRGIVVEDLRVPVVGLVTERVDDLSDMGKKHRYALRVALVSEAQTLEAHTKGADFVIPRPFRPDSLP